MRTKTLLLTAAAILTAGLVKLQADPVYSQNVVGYASVQTLTPNAFYMLECPFNVGASNGVNEIFPDSTPLPNGTQIYTWNPNQTFSIIVYDNTGGNNSLPFNWFQSDDTTPVTQLPQIFPGQGFFLLPNGPITNVFSGSVAVNVGTSNSIPMNTANAFYMVGAIVPYAGVITNGTTSGAGANLNALPSGSAVYQWNPNNQSFVISIYDTSGGNNSLPDLWYQSDDTTPTAVPSLNVADGFFLLPNGTYNWTNGLSP